MQYDCVLTDDAETVRVQHSSEQVTCQNLHWAGLLKTASLCPQLSS